MSSVMAEKHLGTIKQYSQRELMQFLQTNGYSDVSDVLSSEGIINGENFLNLNELQMLKWKVPSPTRKKILSLIIEIKKNPEKFIIKDKPRPTVNRRPSLRADNKFLQNLQRVIACPKIPDNKPVTKGPEETIKHRPRALSPPPPPPGDYLPMHQNIRQSDKLKNDGYLTPIKKSFEENEYEPSPSEQDIPFSAPSFESIRHRPPLTLPRASTDDRGYISGPEKPQNADKPRLLNSGKNNVPLYRPPNEIPNVPMAQFDDDDDKEVAYEPVDYGDAETSSISSGSTIYSGSPQKFKMENYENKDIMGENYHVNRNTSGRRSIKHRPLPAVPVEEKKASNLEDPIEAYENIEKTNKSSEDIVRSLQVRRNSQETKSRSESDSENLSFYGNVDEIPTVYENLENEQEKPKYPEIKEKVLPPKKPSKKPLPIPALNTSNAEDESEEYGSFLSNVNNEPFYRNTDRKGSKLLLHDLPDGAFLFRPSKMFFLTLSLKYEDRYFHLGIEKTSNNKIRLHTTGDNMSPEFATLSDFVAHFTRERLTFDHQGMVIETFLSTILPPSRF